MSTDTETVALPIEYLDVAPSAIAQHPDNPRHDVGDITDITASAKDRGILEPLIVALPYEGMKSIGKAKYLLIAGHRRLAAAKKARLKTVPVVVRHDWTTRGDQVSAMMIENLHRRDLTPVEEGEGYQLLMDIEGLSQAKTAARVQQSVKRVRERLKLNKITSPVREKLHEGQITIADAIAIDQFADDPETLDALTKAAADGEKFRWTLERARTEREDLQKREARLQPFRDLGTAIYEAKGYNDRPESYRPLWDLVERPSYDQDETDTAALDHAKTCTGAVVVLSYNTSLEHGCTIPKNHPKAKPAKSKAEQEREAKAKAEKKELETNAATAAGVRLQHLREILAGGPTLPLAKARLIDCILHPTEWEQEPVTRRRLRLLASLLDIPGSDKLDIAALKDVVEPALARLELTALVVAVDVNTHAAQEMTLGSTPEYFYLGGATESWVRSLESDYGYAWSDWERERFKAALEPDTNDQADDEPGEGDA